jgi:hypothetical protein
MHRSEHVSQLDDFARGYPRPQLACRSWISLNGEWDFALDQFAEWRAISRMTAAARGRRTTPSPPAQDAEHAVEPQARGAGPDHAQALADET